MDIPSFTDLACYPPVYVLGQRLADKTCFVTGATSGIGRAAALRMAEEGAIAVLVPGGKAISYIFTEKIYGLLMTVVEGQE